MVIEVTISSICYQALATAPFFLNSERWALVTTSQNVVCFAYSIHVLLNIRDEFL